MIDKEQLGTWTGGISPELARAHLDELQRAVDESRTKIKNYLTPARLTMKLQLAGFKNSRLRINRGYGYTMFETSDRETGKPTCIIYNDTANPKLLNEIAEALWEETPPIPSHFHINDRGNSCYLIVPVHGYTLKDLFEAEKKEK